MKIFFLTFTTLIGLTSFAQNSNLQKSSTGVQVGLFGLDIFHEVQVANKLTLRADASLFPTIWGGDMYAKDGFAFYPAVTIQPKYYYNIDKRAEKGKDITKNAANYFGLQLRYLPDWFVISAEKNVQVLNQINIVPTYGFRRNISEKFNYEFKAGIGYGTTVGYDYNVSDAVIDLSFKIGYDF